MARLGFHSLTPERRREIASLGGKAIPAEKRAFAVDNALAREAGMKGAIKRIAKMGQKSHLKP